MESQSRRSRGRGVAAAGLSESRTEVGASHHKPLVLGLAGLMVALFVGVLVFLALGWGTCDADALAPGPRPKAACAELNRTNELGAESEGLGMGGVGLAIGLIGCFVAYRRNDNAIGWWFAATGVMFLINAFMTPYAVRAMNEAPGSLPLGKPAAVLVQIFGGPIIFLGFIFLFLLFPTGRLLSRRWRWVARAALVSFGFSTLGGAMDSPLRMDPLGENPIGWQAFQDVREVPEIAAGIVMLVVVLASLASMVVRFKRSRGEERQQMRWITWAAGLLALTLVLAPIFWSTPSLEPLWGFLWLISVGSIPVTAAIAILKYRLYDIDVIVNRTLVYAALTAILAGAYLAIVVVLQRLLEPVTAESDLAVAASTLTVAALFRPLRGRVQTFIDHRFYRRKYDATQTLNGFSARLRDQIDLDAVAAELVKAVGDSIQPAHASVWLRQGEGSP